MRIESQFTVLDNEPQPIESDVDTAATLSRAQMKKLFNGDMKGHSVTHFIGLLNQGSQSGSYVATECVTATIGEKVGTFALAHTSTMQKGTVTFAYLTVVPESGTRDFEGITGLGGIHIAEDGTHTLWLDYELPE